VNTRKLLKTAGVRLAHFHGLCPTEHFVRLAQRVLQHYFVKIFFSSFFSSTGNEQPRPVCIF
jgi:hypothetical protein